jgi:hypothetical protein
MLKAYKNQIFQYLLNHELSIDNFEIKDEHTTFPSIGSRSATIIAYKSEPDLKFGFLETSNFDSFYGAAAFFTPKFKFTLLSPVQVEFNNVFAWFKDWIQEIYKYNDEINTPDLWSTYRQRLNANDITAIDYSNKDQFSDVEKDSIKIALNELQSLIIDKYAKHEEQQRLVTHHILYLTERVDALNKTDWKGILINTFISICIALSLDAQKGQELLNLVIQIFQFSPGLLSS